MNAAMKQLGLARNGENSVVTAWVSPDGHFAFCELRSIDEATAALTHLNGVQVGVYALKIGRPKGYNPNTVVGGVAVPMQAPAVLGNPMMNPLMAAAAPSLMGLSGLGSTVTEALSNAIMVTNLPPLIMIDQILELFQAFGEVCLIINDSLYR
jgi:splicing factor U2AF subunit